MHIQTSSYLETCNPNIKVTSKYNKLSQQAFNQRKFPEPKGYILQVRHLSEFQNNSWRLYLSAILKILHFSLSYRYLVMWTVTEWLKYSNHKLILNCDRIATNRIKDSHEQHSKVISSLLFINFIHVFVLCVFFPSLRLYTKIPLSGKGLAMIPYT